MRYIINSTTTRIKGWQADCWNWAKANKPFKLYGIGPEHEHFCQAVAASCNCKFHSHMLRNESVATFLPAPAAA
ncbi:MAG TPA: hypothetical protein VGN23_01000 [Verrucomicrobiae bacterium]|jgi:hypothetical protein